MTTIDAVDAWEVLDSRGSPTVRVEVKAGGVTGIFTVPAGASTGRFEAIEKRDGGDRYGGAGVQSAISAVIEELAPAVIGHPVSDQETLDSILESVDGTKELSRLGANAVLGVSGATARTASQVNNEPLYASLAHSEPGRIPVPLVNVISGGLHSDGTLPIQDIMLVPLTASSYASALEQIWQARTGIRKALVTRGHRPLIADEGGFSPPISDIDAAFEIVDEGIRRAGMSPGDEIGYAVDIAASHFYEEERYQVEANSSITTSEMVERMTALVDVNPIVAIEDPLAEDDWTGWHRLQAAIGESVLVIGDDLLVTNEERLERAITEQACNAVLVKPNQAGTVSRARAVSKCATDAGFGQIISARSGETADTTIADLAVAWDAGLIKIGSLARSERLAKYNRLLEIERTGPCAYASAAMLFPRA